MNLLPSTYSTGREHRLGTQSTQYYYQQTREVELLNLHTEIRNLFNFRISKEAT